MPKSKDVPLKWDKPVERAAALVFEGRWTQEEIAQKLRDEFSEGSPRFTLSTRALKAWIAHPDFQARLAQQRADFAASIAHVTYADKARRIIALDQMAELARREFEDAPRLREVRPTRDGEIVNEAFNRDAHDAFRGALDDIAKELGHRQSKVDVTSAGEKLSGIADLVGALLGGGVGGASGGGTVGGSGGKALEEARIVDALDELAARADRGAGR